MTLPDRDGLAHELQQLLDDYRDATTPTEAEQGRLWQRIGVGVATPAAAASSGMRIVLGVALLAGTGAIVAAAGRPNSNQSEQRDAITIAGAEPSARVMTPSPALPPPHIGAAPRTFAPERTEPAPRNDRGPAATSAVDDAFARELALLQRARVALGRGDAEGALGVLAEHERSFPTGALVEERRAVRIIALCDAGKAPQGRAEARNFLAAHPSSTLAGRIRSACAIEP